VTHIKQKLILSHGVDIITSSYYIHGPWCDDLYCFFICVLHGPYMLL